MATARQDILKRYPNVAVIGAGVIGASWAALFLAHGLNVVVSDPQPDIETKVRDMLDKAAPTLKALGLPHEGLDKNLRFEPDLERAVKGVDLVQENGPENPNGNKSYGRGSSPRFRVTRCCYRRVRRGRQRSRASR